MAHIPWEQAETIKFWVSVAPLWKFSLQNHSSDYVTDRFS